MYSYLAVIVNAIMKIWVKDIRGIEHLAHLKKKPYIVCPNHSSFLDDFLVPSAIMPRTKQLMHMYVNRNYFRFFLFRWFLHHVQSIPVVVDKAPGYKTVNQEASRTALLYLKRGDIICIYPEGHRSRDGELQKAKTGAVALALAAGVPIVPVGIVGTRDVLPKGNFFPKLGKKVFVNIGKPIPIIEMVKNTGRPTKKELHFCIKKVMQAIAGMIGKEYLH
ncbi:1-acyl-sn-glycerol-3-phosphate acyltransferase [Candidatus Woesearchaeota archaeon]|nr:1-acyl-sn-glycerol-3-phosphate acyltransferase [Candidatus Woesearchaeota archaeon]